MVQDVKQMSEKTETSPLKHQLLYEAAMLAGEITLESGAEIFRVEDTMHRIMNLSHLESVEIFATTTGIFATLADPSIQPITQVRRITSRANNLNRICQVNEVSRELCSGVITPEEAIQRLKEIQNLPPYPKSWVMAAFLISTMGFAALFGGGIREVLGSGAACIAMQTVGVLILDRVSNDFMESLLKTIVIALVTEVCCVLFPLMDGQIVIISSIMPLVPGVPITNAIRDTLQGDYTAGLSRAAEAFVIALAIAAGSVAGMGLFQLLPDIFCKKSKKQ